MTSYDQLENDTLRQLALRTLTDPKATPDDKAAARSRLLAPTAQDIDGTKLTPAERGVLIALLARSLGEEVDLRQAVAALAHEHGIEASTPAPSPPPLPPAPEPEPATCPRCSEFPDDDLQDLRAMIAKEREEDGM